MESTLVPYDLVPRNIRIYLKSLTNWDSPMDSDFDHFGICLISSFGSKVAARVQLRACMIYLPQKWTSKPTKSILLDIKRSLLIQRQFLKFRWKTRVSKWDHAVKANQFVAKFEDLYLSLLFYREIQNFYCEQIKVKEKLLYIYLWTRNHILKLYCHSV